MVVCELNHDGPFREVVPGVALSSDFISGFCGVGRRVHVQACLTHGGLEGVRVHQIVTKEGTNHDSVFLI